MTSPITSVPAGAAAPWAHYSSRQRWLFLAVLFLITILGNFDYYVLGVVLDPIKQEFRVSDTALGFLSGVCFALCYALAALPFARWSDRGNRRTVLVFALIGWSAMTLLFGMARSFWQLGLARLGVGAMEPGAIPPAQSLIADYFPPEQRGLALSVMIAGASVGYLMGLALGGYMAATVGWRAAFLVAGAVGIFLAFFARAILSEPRLRVGFPSHDPNAEGLYKAIGRLRVKPSYLYTLVGLAALYFFSLGVTTFIPSFMIRTFHVSLEQVSVSWGIAVSVANLLGTLAGGWIADRLGRRDIRWYGWLSFGGCILGAILYWCALLANDVWTFISIEFMAELAIWGGTFASWPAIHAICGNARRGTAIAIAICVYVLIGSGLGPLAAGALSDALSPRYGADSLHQALNVMTLSLIPAALAFYWSARSMRRDEES